MSNDDLPPRSVPMGEKQAGWGALGKATVVLGLAAVGSVGLIAALWCVPYLPTNDGPNHILLGFIENHYSDPARRYGDYLEYGQPVTALGFSVLFSSLEQWLPWRDALRATLSIIALAFSWGYFGLVAAIDRKRLPLGLLGFAAAICWPLYMGFFSYVFATGIGFAVLALTLRRPHWQLRDRLAIGALLIIQAVTHVFAAQLSCIALLVVVLVRCYRDKLWRNLCWWAAWTLIPAAVTLMTASVSQLDSQLAIKESFGLDRLLLLGAAFVSGPGWRAWPLVLLALFGIGWAARRAYRGRLSRDEVALLVVSGLMLALALLLPFHITGWEYLSPRFIPLAMMLGALLLPMERLSTKGRAYAVVGLGLYMLGSIGWAARFNQELYQRVAPALAGLDAPLQRTGPRLALVLEPYAGLPDHTRWQQARVPFIAPLFNLGQIYAVEQGGIPSWSFIDKPQLHSFVLTREGRRRYPPVPDVVEIYQSPALADPSSRRRMLSFLASVGSRFEDIIFWGQPDDGQVLRQRGYQPDVQQGGLFVARFEGCPVTLRIAAESKSAHRLIVQTGWDLGYPLTSEYVLPAGVEPVEGQLSVPISRCLCGPVWLRVALDADDSDSISPGDRFCEAAGPAGAQWLQLTEPDTQVHCRIPW